MKQFRLPDPGEGLVEAEIVTWRVAVGDEVKVNDIVVEVETSKSLVELPVPFAGTVSALLVKEGDMVDVGAPIITIDDGVSAPVAPDGDKDAAAEGGDGNGRVAMLVGYGPRTGETKRRPRRVPAGEQCDAEAHALVADTFNTSAPVSFRADQPKSLPASHADPAARPDAAGAPLPTPGAAPAEPVGLTQPTVPAEPRSTRSTVLAKPPVRKLAKDLGVDLTSVTGSGAGGVVTRGDVEAVAAESAHPALPAFAHETAVPNGRGPSETGPSETVGSPGLVPPLPRGVPAEDVRVPVRGVRKATAEAMVASAFTAPHVTEWLTCDVSAAMELLERLKGRREFAGVRISPLLLVAKAVCLALVRRPGLNASWDAQAGEIVLKGTVNLGVAAATPRGLMVPNIKNAQQLSLLELAGAVNELVRVAKDGKTQPADTAQGTFTITNVGVFGVDAGTPILNPGQAGILCLGAVGRRPWVIGSGAHEQIVPRWVTTLAVSFDHRVVDGEQGSKFLADVAAVLSDPGLALLF